MAGLAPDTLRELPPDEAELPEEQDVAVDQPEGDIETLDEGGNVISIEHPDGEITINLDGPVRSADAPDVPPPGWFDNLADQGRISDAELSRIADDLLRQIDQDIESRTEWVTSRADGIRMLGFKLSVPNTSGSSDGAPVEGMSTVRHPLMAQAVLNFQANSRSEMLPTDGPVKIRDDNNNPSTDEDELAEDFQRDLNHYLTVTAREYYPDTDRMLLSVGFGGLGFKKVYYCPLRQRPVSESVDADDLIVNNSATDLKNAKRVTHRSNLSPNTIKRLQILGVYRDISLSQANVPKLDAAQQEKKDQQGVTVEAFDPEDRDRLIYECYCELDIKGFEHKAKGKETGLEIPYRVTIDETTRQILSIVRDYNEDTKDLPEKRTTFVKYPFIPGFGFYDLGFVHILGNTTNALTAAWRELLDAGMFACFPGFLLADAGGRQNTNIFRIPPGGGALVKTGGLPISQAAMPLPYKEPSQALMNLVGQMAETGQRLAGAADLMVGEGKQDMPVGTILAVIEQATKVENAIHKRLHSAQAEELQLLVDCFREHPESFWQRNRRPARKWDEETFRRALDSVDLVPQSDPNTSSHTQRIMKAVALKQLSMANPQAYDVNAIDTVIIRTLGYSNPEQFFAKTPQQNPMVIKEQAKAQSDGKRAEAAMVNAQANMVKAKGQGLSGGKSPEELQLDQQRLALDAQDQHFTQSRAATEDENRDKDRQADLVIAASRLDGDLVKQREQQRHERGMQNADHIVQTLQNLARPQNQRVI
jgi:hypothetical protein